MSYSFETRTIAPFTALDYALFGLMLAGSAAIGIFYAIKDRNANSTKEFLLAGGNMNPIPVALSILASFMSAITLLGTPSEMYNYTTMYWYIGIGYFLVVAAAAHLFIPIFYKLRVTSAYEYLELRFNKLVRTAGSLTFCTQMILYMAIVLYAPSLALNAVTGFTLWGAIISVGIVCTFYTALGGLKAVLWTDTFQVFVMFAGLFAIVIKGTRDVGGLTAAWDYFDKSGRVVWDDFSPDPKTRHSAWSLVIGGMFTWVAIYGTNQAQVQRACSCSTLKEAQIAMWINFPGLCLILYLGCFIGVAVYSLYRYCDPIKFGLITASDQLLPLFVMDVLGNIHGVPGLFVASLFSGALSTISSGLNSIAACLLEDVIKEYFVKDMSEKRATLTSRILAVVLGVVCLGLTYVASKLGSVLQAALSLFGMIGGPLLGLFTLGMMFPWSNSIGAFVGLMTGLVFMFWIGVGAHITKPYIPKAPINVTGCNWELVSTTMSSNMTTLLNYTTPATVAVTNSTMAAVTKSAAEIQEENGGIFYPLYSLSYLWYSATAVAVVVGVGMFVSFLTGFKKPSELDPRLQIPLFDIIFPFLPEKILKPLRFGVRYDLIPQYESDLRHTAMDLSRGEVNKFFDIELEAAALKDKESNDSKTTSMIDIPNGHTVEDADDHIEVNGKQIPKVSHM